MVTLGLFNKCHRWVLWWSVVWACWRHSNWRSRGTVCAWDFWWSCIRIRWLCSCRSESVCKQHCSVSTSCLRTQLFSFTHVTFTDTLSYLHTRSPMKPTRTHTCSRTLSWLFSFHLNVYIDNIWCRYNIKTKEWEMLNAGLDGIVQRVQMINGAIWAVGQFKSGSGMKAPASQRGWMRKCFCCFYSFVYSSHTLFCYSFIFLLLWNITKGEMLHAIWCMLI